MAYGDNIKTIQKLEELLASDKFKNLFSSNKNETLLRAFGSLPENLRLQALNTVFQSDVFNNKQSWDREVQLTFMGDVFAKIPSSDRPAAFDMMMDIQIGANFHTGVYAHTSFINKVISSSGYQQRYSYISKYLNSQHFTNFSKEQQKNFIFNVFSSYYTDWTVDSSNRPAFMEQILSLDAVSSMDIHQKRSIVLGFFGEGDNARQALSEGHRGQGFTTLISSNLFDNLSNVEQAALAKDVLPQIPKGQMAGAAASLIQSAHFEKWKQQDQHAFALQALNSCAPNQKQALYNVLVQSAAYQQSWSKEQKQAFDDDIKGTNITTLMQAHRSSASADEREPRSAVAALDEQRLAV